MNKLTEAKRVAVISSLVEGNSIRATVRMTGVAKNTIVKLLEEVGAVKKWVMGQPDKKLVSTSHVERQNLTMRMSMRRFTRLTNAFSKKIENHRHAVALHFMHYNFCRSHMTLTKANRGIHMTPAMAAGVSDHVWTIQEIVALLSNQ